MRVADNAAALDKLTEIQLHNLSAAFPVLHNATAARSLLFHRFREVRHTAGTKLTDAMRDLLRDQPEISAEILAQADTITLKEIVPKGSLATALQCDLRLNRKQLLYRKIIVFGEQKRKPQPAASNRPRI